MRAIYENHYLSDQDVANYARQSFGRLAQEFTPAQNNKLVQFLARGMESGKWEELLHEMLAGGTGRDVHDLAVYLRSIPEHWVPFAHPHITLRMQAPVPITVQCYKHKMGYVESGESRRYVKSRPEIFIPEFREAAANVKQGSAGKHPQADYWRAEYTYTVNRCLEMYERMIADGVCPEQARFVLPQGTELNWVWTGSLYAYANFFNQRTDPHSQKEIQDLARQVGEIIEPLYPVSWAALTRGEY